MTNKPLKQTQEQNISWGLQENLTRRPQYIPTLYTSTI